jgi:hypothetical protein
MQLVTVLFIFISVAGPVVFLQILIPLFNLIWIQIRGLYCKKVSLVISYYCVTGVGADGDVVFRTVSRSYL